MPKIYKYCKCGCGSTFYGPNLYIKGHWNPDPKTKIPEHKECTKCKQILPKEKFKLNNYFSIRKKCVIKYINSWCKQCSYKISATYDRRIRESGRSKNADRKRQERIKNNNNLEYYLKHNIFKYRGRSQGKFDLTIEYLIEQFNVQNGKCYYTGKPLIYQMLTNVQIGDKMSLDKKNPDLGYVMGNVVWCLHRINSMKGHRTEEEFIKQLENILEYREGKSNNGDVCNR